MLTQEAVTLICNRPAPVLFVDTCAILDGFRSPYRKDINISILEKIKLIEQLAAQSLIWVTTSETVRHEYSSNKENAELALDKEISQFETLLKRINSCNRIFLGQDYKIITNQKTIVEKIRLLLDSFMSKSLTITPEPIHSHNGIYRGMHNKRPAQKGKSELKDCQIFETFLDLAKQLRQSAFTESIIFITSNHQDYGKPTDSEILHEFSTISATYVNTFEWALSEAGIHA